MLAPDGCGSPGHRAKLPDSCLGWGKRKGRQLGWITWDANDTETGLGVRTLESCLQFKCERGLRGRKRWGWGRTMLLSSFFRLLLSFAWLLLFVVGSLGRGEVSPLFPLLFLFSPLFLPPPLLKWSELV